MAVGGASARCPSTHRRFNEPPHWPSACSRPRDVRLSKHLASLQVPLLLRLAEQRCGPCGASVELHRLADRRVDAAVRRAPRDRWLSSIPVARRRGRGLAAPPRERQCCALLARDDRVARKRLGDCCSPWLSASLGAAADDAAQIAHKRQAGPAGPHPPGEAGARTGPSATPAARPTRASGTSTATITSMSGRLSARSTCGRGPLRHRDRRKHGAGRAKAITYRGRQTLALGRRQKVRHLQSRPVPSREGTRGGHAAGTRTGDGGIEEPGGSRRGPRAPARPEAHDRAGAPRDAERIEKTRVKDETPEFQACVSAGLA